MRAFLAVGIVLLTAGGASAQAPARVPCSSIGGSEAGLWCVPIAAPTPTPSPAPTPCEPRIVDGLVADQCARPMTALAKPGYLQAVTDPEFGTRIVRLSALPASDGENAVVKPAYSTQSAWNADESLLLLWRRGGNGRRYQLLDGKTYAWKREVLLATTDIEAALWSPTDPDALYYPTNTRTPPALMRYTPSTGAVTVQRSFSDCPGSELSLGSDPGSTSWAAAAVVALMCGERKFLYSIGLDMVLGAATTPGRLVPMASASGTMAAWWGMVHDHLLRPLRALDIKSPAEHASIGFSAASGHDIYNTVAFDPGPGGSGVGSLVSIDMATGASKVIVGPATGWPYPPSGTHISSSAWKAPGKVAVSIVGNPAGQRVLDQELLLADIDTGEVRRVAHHRSHAGEGPWGYWGEPHAVISPSGKRILFASDWGGGPTVDTYVVELP